MAKLIIAAALQALTIDGIAYRAGQLIVLEDGIAKQRVKAGELDTDTGAIAYRKEQGEVPIKHVDPADAEAPTGADPAGGPNPNGDPNQPPA